MIFAHGPPVAEAPRAASRSRRAREWPVPIGARNARRPKRARPGTGEAAPSITHFRTPSQGARITRHRGAPTQAQARLPQPCLGIQIHSPRDHCRGVAKQKVCCRTRLMPPTPSTTHTTTPRAARLTHASSHLADFEDGTLPAAPPRRTQLSTTTTLRPTHRLPLMQAQHRAADDEVLAASCHRSALC